MLVESLVREVVGAFVLFARNVLDLDVRKRGQQLFRASVERLKPLLLDPIASVHLLDDQLGVEAHLERVGLPRLDCFESVDEGVVLGLVVGHHPQPAVHGLQLHALLVLDDDARGGTWAQIASFSVMTSASSIFHSASWVRRPGSSSVDVRVASSSSLVAERTDSSAASASSMMRSWASSSSTKRAFMCATSSDI